VRISNLIVYASLEFVARLNLIISFRFDTSKFRLKAYNYINKTLTMRIAAAISSLVLANAFHETVHVAGSYVYIYSKDKKTRN